jgi:polyisoprenoid-binding protein YceI
MHAVRHACPTRWSREACCALGLLAAGILLAGAAPGPGTHVILRIEPDSSRVEYHITNPIGDVTNLAGLPAGEVQADSVHGASLAGTITVDLRQLTTGIGMRDRHVKSPSILDVEAYPRAEFVLRGTETEAGDAAVGRESEGVPAMAHGTLTLHGVAREIDIPVQLRWQQAQLRVRGSFTIQLADYGIPRPRRLVIVAGKSVDVRLDLLFVP